MKSKHDLVRPHKTYSVKLEHFPHANIYRVSVLESIVPAPAESVWDRDHTAGERFVFEYETKYKRTAKEIFEVVKSLLEIV